MSDLSYTRFARVLTFDTLCNSLTIPAARLRNTAKRCRSLMMIRASGRSTTSLWPKVLPTMAACASLFGRSWTPWLRKRGRLSKKIDDHTESQRFFPSFAQTRVRIKPSVARASLLNLFVAGSTLVSTLSLPGSNSWKDYVLSWKNDVSFPASIFHGCGTSKRIVRTNDVTKGRIYMRNQLPVRSTQFSFPMWKCAIALLCCAFSIEPLFAQEVDWPYYGA